MRDYQPIDPQPYLNQFTLRTEGPYYTSYYKDIRADYHKSGLEHDSLNWGDVPILSSMKNDFINLFNTMYDYREIGQETFDRWQYTINRRFETVKRRYEMQFTMYADEHLTDLGAAKKSVTDYTSQSSSSQSGSQHSDTDSKYLETPITQLEQSQDYATTKDKETSNSNNQNEYSGTGSGNTVKTETRFDNSMIKYLNDFSDDWRDLKLSFVKEFADCFFQIVAKV